METAGRKSSDTRSAWTYKSTSTLCPPWRCWGRRRRRRRRRTRHDAPGLAIRRLGIAGHHAVCDGRSLRQPNPSFDRSTLSHSALRNGGIDCRRGRVTCLDTLGQKSADTLALDAIDVDIPGLLWTHADSFKRTFKRGYRWGAASIDCPRCRRRKPKLGCTPMAAASICRRQKAPMGQFADRGYFDMRLRAPSITWGLARSLMLASPKPVRRQLMRAS
jgi:hypothetical protein